MIIRLIHDQLDRMVHQSLDEQIELQMYYKNKNYYVFLFSLVNDSNKFDKKKNWFFIRKTVK